MSTLEDIPIIDADTHVIEPPDLWTSRVPERWGSRRPSVRWDPESQREAWFIGDRPVTGVGTSAMAGWGEYPPEHPRTWDDIDPVMYDATTRLAMMDAYGIHAQVLYPNLLLFHGDSLQDADEQALQLACIQAYNDYLSEWSEAAPDRLIPVTALPFWSLEASLAEIDRAADNGHRGVIFTQDPTFFGLPALADVHWDPMWRRLEERELPVNFHIGSAGASAPPPPSPQTKAGAAYAAMGVSFFTSNAKTIATLTCGGVCHRFPKLNFVSVESGIGWIPYALAALDWQWKNCGVALESPEYDLLPSEYFRRQIYGCFWFEQETALSAIEQLGPDNILYETDFPHPTSMSPGPATAATTPPAYLREALVGVDDDVSRRILHDNAARLYKIGTAS